MNCWLEISLSQSQDLKCARMFSLKWITIELKATIRIFIVIVNKLKKG